VDERAAPLRRVQHLGDEREGELRPRRFDDARPARKTLPLRHDDARGATAARRLQKFLVLDEHHVARLGRLD
jgi:hypothetical protein